MPTVSLRVLSRNKPQHHEREHDLLCHFSASRARAVVFHSF
jgi:hypothetical protein